MNSSKYCCKFLHISHCRVFKQSCLVINFSIIQNNIWQFLPGMHVTKRKQGMLHMLPYSCNWSLHFCSWKKYVKWKLCNLECSKLIIMPSLYKNCATSSNRVIENGVMQKLGELLVSHMTDWTKFYHNTSFCIAKQLFLSWNFWKTGR